MRSSMESSAAAADAATAAGIAPTGGVLAGARNAAPAALQLDGETMLELLGIAVGAVAVVLVVVAGGIAVLVARSRRRKRRRIEQRQADERLQLSLEQLKQRADVALVRLDDTVQQAEQELDFAAAQFGADQVERYRMAVRRAKGGLQEAFTLQQQLDDAFPDTDQERQDWSSRILQIAEGATGELAGHAQEFEELRDLANTAPQALDAAAAARVTLVARTADAREVLDGLQQRYAGASIESVRENIAGAERLLAAIDEAVAQGRATSDGQAAVAVHAAEAAVAQAQSLLSGVERVGDDLAASEERLRALVDETETDVAVARSMPKGAGDLGPVIQLAEQAIAEARRSPVDVATALPRLQRANDTLDRVTGQSRAESERRDRIASSLEGWLTSARSNLDAAEQYVSTRRIAVGAHARQLLALAQDDLARALRLQATDVAGAVASARSASERAEQALREAQDDAGEFSGYAPGSLRGPMPGGRGGMPGGLGGLGTGGLGAGLGSLAGGMGGGLGGALVGGVIGSVLGNILNAQQHPDDGTGSSASDGGFFGGFGDGSGPFGDADGRPRS